MDDEIDDGAGFGPAADQPLPEAPEGPYRGDEAAMEPAAPVDSRRRSDAQARIDAVTRARREAERERDYWRERASASGGDDSVEREDLPGGSESTDSGSRGPAGRDMRSAASAGREDDDVDFGDGAVDPAEVIAFLREQARAELIAEAEAFEAQESARGAAAVWEDRQAAFAAVRPDYVEAVMGSDWACSETMADAIQDSDAGPALAYHLASHPDEAARIAALSPLSQVRALGRIEAGLTDGMAPAMSISAAPAPPPSLRGSGGRFRPAPDTDDFAAFDRAYGAR